MSHGRFLFLLLALPVLIGCAPAPSPNPADARARLIEQRKDAVIAQLADCESGTGGVPSGGPHVGRLQFTPATVVAFVRERDGRTISTREAIALASDYGQAAALAKYVIFERNGLGQWPASSRKLGLARQVSEIRAL